MAIVPPRSGPGRKRLNRGRPAAGYREAVWPLLIILACSPASRRITAPPVQVQPRSEVPAPARTAVLDAAIRREQGDLMGAVTSLARARAFDPDSPWLRLRQAEIAVAVGDLESADVLLAEVEASQPEIAELWVYRGRVLLKRGDAAAAGASAARALAIRPQDAEAWSLRLDAAGREGAAEVARAWRQIPLTRPEDLGARGLALMSVDPSLALDDLGAAFARGSVDARVISGLAEAGVRSHRLRSALGWLDRRPDAEGLTLGYARVKLGEAAGDPWVELDGLITVQAWRSTVHGSAEDALVWRARVGLQRYILGAPAKTLRGLAAELVPLWDQLPPDLVFDVLLAAGSTEPLERFLNLQRAATGDEGLTAQRRARVLASRGDWSGVKRTLSEAWSKNPTPLVGVAWASELVRRGQAEEAVSVLAPLVAANDPQHREALLAGLAEAREANGQPDLAAASWEALLQADPHHPQALLASARALARSPAGPARAIPRVEQALESRPSMPEAWSLYAELLDAAGAAEQAAFARDNAARYASLRRLP